MLKHITVEGRVSGNDTSMGISVDGDSLFTLEETQENGRSVLRTELLPNRELTSAQNALDALFPEDETAEPAEEGTDALPGGSFDLNAALTEAEACYRQLTDAIQPYAEEKKANYTIKNVGKGKWVRLAKLTAEQAERQWSFQIPPELKEIITRYTEGKDPEAYLILGHASSPAPLSREQAYRAFKSAGKSMGLTSIGAQTMRKTFAWRYYKSTGDIYYLQNLLNHASPSITYRYIGEKPNVEVYLKKMTPEENERSRYMLYKNGNGKKRIEAIREMLSAIDAEMDNPLNNDAYYGRVDCLLTEMEDLVENFNKTK